MIKFKKLKLKNFRSYGNNFTEINFEDGFDIVNGKNGHGKSSWVNALTYCLFGKIPKLKISELINNINNSDMLTEVEFFKKTDKYLVRRGEKPKLFEIYKNGELIDQKSKSLDYQEMLEKEIIGINLQSFQMLVSLDTSLLNKSFITMTEAERRAFLETVLDIKILFYITQIANTRINMIKTQKTELEYKIKTRKEILDSEIKKLDDIKKINKDITENGNQLLKTREEKVSELKEKLDNYILAFQKIEDAETNLVHLQKKLDEFSEIIETKKKEYSKVDKKLIQMKSIQETAVVCKKCGEVNTSEDVTETMITEATSIKETLKEELIHFKKMYDDEKEIFDKNNKIAQEKTRININYNNTQDDYKIAVDEYEKAKNFKLLDENNSEINRLQGEIDAFQTEYNEITNNEDSLTGIKKLASEEGIKKKIFEKYIPLFNTHLNQHLLEFNLNYNIIFNDKFEISILDRGEERSYYTFSASEKMRINLAIMFSFLKLIENKNGFSMNILLIDELLDNALSSEVLDIVLRFLKYKIKDKDKIIISHKTDIDLTLFDRTFFVSKENGFSSLNQIKE